MIQMFTDIIQLRVAGFTMQDGGRGGGEMNFLRQTAQQLVRPPQQAATEDGWEQSGDPALQDYGVTSLFVGGLEHGVQQDTGPGFAIFPPRIFHFHIAPSA